MLPVDRKLQRPQVHFDPAFYRRARRQHDQGDSSLIIAMMKEAALDPYIVGCLTGRKAGFQRSWSVGSPDDVEVPAERRDWLAAVLRRRLKVRKLLRAMFEALLYGYVVIDPHWDVIDGRHVATGFTRYEQHHFARDRNGELRMKRGGSLVEIPEGVLVCESDEPAVMLPILAAFILKDFGKEAWASFLENWGEALVIGRYPDGSKDDLKQEVDDAVNQIASSSRGSAPKSAEIEIKESQRTSGDHRHFIRDAKEDISIGLLGHSNAASSGEGMQVGENLTAFHVRNEISVDDMQALEEFIEPLIGTMWARNFTGEPAVFELNKTKPIDAKEHLDKLDLLYRHQVEIHPDEYRKLDVYIDPAQQPIRRPDSSFRFE